MTETDLGTTASGLDANVAATLAYSLGWVTGLAFLFFEEENKFVRFHALSVWFVGWILAFLVIPPVSAVLWLILMFKAYQGERFKLPGVGDLAEQRL